MRRQRHKSQHLFARETDRKTGKRYRDWWDRPESKWGRFLQLLTPTWKPMVYARTAEKARRVRQIERGQLRAENGLVHYQDVAHMESAKEWKTLPTQMSLKVLDD